MIMADQGAANTSTSSTLVRNYRKGNWTVNETMVLIEAKKMDDERRMKRITGNDNEQGRSGTSTPTSNKPAELRWKWVEDYCWRKGCLRSQNQCNDKWDNLMRDYKKVRDYERKVAEKSGGEGGVISEDHQSYWKIEKNERKERNLPTNMLPQIYEALVDVVERKSQRLLGGVSGVSSIPSSSPSIGYPIVERSTSVSGGGGGGVIQHPHHQLQQPPLMTPQAPLQQHHQYISAPPIAALPLAPAPVTVVAAEVAVAPPTVQAQTPPALPYSQPLLPTMCDSSDSDTSERPNSPAKRRRTASDYQHHHHEQHQGTAPTTSTTPSGSSSDQVVATAISKSASIIAEALQASEEREERRHRDLLSLHEKRLKIEEKKTEVNRQGINGLVDAINKLANSIQALASERSQSTSKPS